MEKPRIAVLTSGGDAPGMNAAVRAVVRTGVDLGAAVVGVRRGFAGLMNGDFRPLGPRDVGGVLEWGGTFLESARSDRFQTDDGRQQALDALAEARVDSLVVIGGSGTQRGSEALNRLGFPVVGIASTIDNDLYGSDITLGVDTALNIALESIDRLRTTAASHRRVSIVEVMGRDCGYLALAAGLAGGAEVIVTPEFDHSVEDVIQQLHEAYRRGKRSVVVVVAEGVRNRAQQIFDALRDDPEGTFEPRITVLGHVQRGGKPTAFDRLLGTRLGARAAELLAHRQHGVLVGLRDGSVAATALSEVAGRSKPLPEELRRLAAIMRL